MKNVKRIVVRILKCLLCIFTGGFRDKGKGGGNEASC